MPTGQHDEIDQVLAHTLEIVEGLPESLTPEAEQQVQALFAELARTALERAQGMRTGEPAQPPPGDGWAQRYRRMVGARASGRPEAGGKEDQPRPVSTSSTQQPRTWPSS